MIFRSRIFTLIFILATLFPGALFSQEIVHVVQRGETIFSIARSFGVNREELMRINGISDPTRLQVGQTLRIPRDPRIPQDPRISQDLQIPGASALEGSSELSEGLVYRVVRGDTLYGIARRHGLTVNELLTSNGFPSNYVLRQGDVLRIPGTQSVSITQNVSGTHEGPVLSRPAETRALDLSIRWPVVARELSYMTGNAGGVIITGERAEPVRSLTNGTVISAGPYRGYGRVVIVQTTGGYIYVYGGFEILAVREGDRVGSGTEMGRLGVDIITGKPQLFFRVYRNNAPVDPALAPRA